MRWRQASDISGSLAFSRIRLGLSSCVGISVGCAVRARVCRARRVAPAWAAGHDRPVNNQKSPREKHGPHRLLRHVEIQRTHQGNPGQEPKRQYFPDDGPFAELFRAVLPARRRDPPQGRTRSRRARTRHHPHRDSLRGAVRNRRAQAHRQERRGHRRAERGTGKLAVRDLLQRGAARRAGLRRRDRQAATSRPMRPSRRSLPG